MSEQRVVVVMPLVLMEQIAGFIQDLGYDIHDSTDTMHSGAGKYLDECRDDCPHIHLWVNDAIARALAGTEKVES